MVAPKAWGTLPVFLRHPVQSLSRASLSKKLWLSFNLLLLILFAGSWTAWQHIRHIQNDITTLVAVTEPLKEAILEMEINTLETADAVHQYLLTPQPRHKLHFNDSREDFRRFHDRFVHLASTDPHQLELAAHINQLFLGFCKRGEKMMNNADKIRNALNTLRENAILIDEVIDEKLQKQIDKSNPNAITKLEAALDMEINIHEAITFIESYTTRSDPNLIIRYHDAQTDFQHFRKIYQQTNPSTRELELLNHINDLFIKTIKSGDTIIKHRDKFKNRIETFTHMLDRIDDILDDKIQPLIHAQTLNAARDSKAAAQKAAVILILLGILGLFVTVTSALTISRQISDPSLSSSRARKSSHKTTSTTKSKYTPAMSSASWPGPLIKWFGISSNPGKN